MKLWRTWKALVICLCTLGRYPSNLLILYVARFWIQVEYFRWCEHLCAWRFYIVLVEKLKTGKLNRFALSDDFISIYFLCRESPSIHILELLTARGAEVFYVDPWVPEIILGQGKKQAAIPLDSVRWESFDCVALLTKHSAFKIPEMVEKAQILVDGRNATKGIISKKIFKI